MVVSKNKFENLPDDLICKILENLNAQDLVRLSCVNKRIYDLIHNPEGKAPFLWRSCYEKLQANPKIMDLGIVGKEIHSKSIHLEDHASLGTIKNRVWILSIADRIAKLSKDGVANIVTIPNRWSSDHLVSLSEKFASLPLQAGGVPSAKIKYFCSGSYLLSSVVNGCTVIFSNSIIAESHGHLPLSEMTYRGWRIPDALTALTVAVWKRIITKGEASAFADCLGLDSREWKMIRVSNSYGCSSIGSRPGYVLCSGRVDDLNYDGVPAVKYYKFNGENFQPI